MEGGGTLKIAFLGNSLTLYGISEEVGWEYESGMAASSLKNDYVHKTINKIAKTKNISVEYAIVNIAVFERNFEEFDSNSLKKLKDFNADIIIFQLGENVAISDIEQKYEIFINKYTDLLTFFGEDIIKIVCTPFWYNKDKIYAITKVVLNTNSFLVDLSHLDGRFDGSNYAKAERKYDHPGVQVHPGDSGMERISDCIFSIVNAIKGKN